MGVTDPKVAHAMMDRYLKTGILSVKWRDAVTVTMSSTV
jgi:hypothetical protein